MKKLNETAAVMGMAMRYARCKCGLTSDDAATLLRINPSELYEYERGREQVPLDIIERVFVMGYKMIHARALEKLYRRQRRIFVKLKELEAAQTEQQ